MRVGASAWPLAGAFIAFLVLTVALTWPLLPHITTAIPHDAGDPVLNTWILWWNASAVPFTDRWWHAPAFYPARDVLTFSEHLAGVGLISSPIIWITGNPQLAYNIAWLMSYPLSGLAAYLLVLYLTKRHDAAFVGGLAYAFAPYRVAHWPHLQVLSSYWLPIALVGLHKYRDDPRVRWLALFGAATLLQSLCNGYFLLFFPVLIALWTIWFLIAAGSWRRVGGVACACAFVVAPLVPLLWRYRVVHESLGFRRALVEIRGFSADALSVLTAPADLVLWGWLQVGQKPEGELFPGVTVVALAAAALVLAVAGVSGTIRSGRWPRIARSILGCGLVINLIGLAAFLIVGPWNISVLGVPVMARALHEPFTWVAGLSVVLCVTSPRVLASVRRGSVLAFYLVAAVAMWVFCLGPTPAVGGTPLVEDGPYSWLLIVPGFDGLRVPARFWTLATICLAVAAAMGFARLVSLRHPRRRLALGIVCVAILADGWPSRQILASPPAPWPFAAADLGPGPVLELPAGLTSRETAVMYRGMTHTRPVINGYSGYVPPFYPILVTGLEMKEPGVLDVLTAGSPLNVVTHIGGEAGHAGTDFISAYPGARLVRQVRDMALYHVPGGSKRAGPALGKILPIVELDSAVNKSALAAMLDGDLSTRWHTGPQRLRHWLRIDLGAVHQVEAVLLSLGPFVRDFPRDLLVETSVDGDAWREGWRGSTVVAALEAALTDPHQVPVPIGLNRVSARYIRLSLYARDEVFYWSVAELRVHAPPALDDGLR